MAASKKICAFLVISIIIITVDAKPTCAFQGKAKRKLVCRPDNEDYVLKRGLVSDNNRTKEIILKGCRITDIEYQSFENLFAVKYIDLSVNNIQNLKPSVFDGARQVTFLNLSFNLLSDIPPGLFDHNPHLEILDLQENRINSSLSRGVFDRLTKLTHLDLSGNSILGTDIDPFAFNHCRQIQFMNFSKNDLSDSPDNLLHAFQHIYLLNLDKCFLPEVPKFATAINLKTMKHLILSSNQITRIDDPTTFINLDSLEILNLSFNALESLNENVFKLLKELKKIVLNNNLLKTLPETLFQNLAHLVSLNLSHNKIEFVPINAFRGTSLKYLNLADNRFTYLTDNFCLELRNSGAKLTKFFFNQNPWQCACLTQLLNEVKLLGVEYNNVKYDGKEPVCVTTKEFNCKRHQDINQFYVDMYYIK